MPCLVIQERPRALVRHVNFGRPGLKPSQDASAASFIVPQSVGWWIIMRLYITMYWRTSLAVGFAVFGLRQNLVRAGNLVFQSLASHLQWYPWWGQNIHVHTCVMHYLMSVHDLHMCGFIHVYVIPHDVYILSLSPILVYLHICICLSPCVYSLSLSVLSMSTYICSEDSTAVWGSWRNDYAGMHNL